MGNPYGWPPYAVSRDCSLGFCSMYCPQWCYFYFPPPPPAHPSLTLSPLLIAVIVVVSAAFTAAGGYLLSVKYCGNRRRNRPLTALSVPAAWVPAPSTGLDASRIDKLTATYPYRRSAGGGAADCPVCLGEFRDGDRLRLLPKCAHAFHQSCIDTWLGAHSNCPLCRAGVGGELPAAEMADGGFVVAGGTEEEGRREGDDVAIVVVEEGDEGRAAPAAEEEEEESAGRSPAFGKRTSTSRRGNS